MQHFLMCAPEYYEVCYVINPWMEGNQGKVDRGLAQQQWQNLHNLLTAHARVSLIEPAPGLPDMVFTANGGLVLGKQALISNFLHEERQPEAAHFAAWFSSQGYQVLRIDQATVFEGGGDALFDARGRLWFGSGIRSASLALTEIRGALGAETHALELVDPRWYHLDTAFCPLPDGGAMAYATAFSAASIACLDHAFGADIIWVTEQDARNFSCNAIAVNHRLILHRATDELKSLLRKRGIEVIEADVSEFLKAGGACKCMALHI